MSATYGRPHANTLRIIHQLAKRAARRRGLQSAAQLERRPCAKVGVEIWRRAAHMVIACLHRTSDEAAASGGEEEEVQSGRAELPDLATAGP